MNSLLKPIYLLADSQLLFWRENGNLFLDSIKASLTKKNPTAAYIGAANGDRLEFYEMFEDAMAATGVVDCRMIRASFPEDDAKFMEHADLVLLAGGDVAQGWRIFTENGLRKVLARRYREGATLIGVSAGAVHLGRYGCLEHGPRQQELIETLDLVPFMIDVHDERSGWQRLRASVEMTNTNLRGMGIPSGGGVIYYPDGSVEPVRQRIMEFMMSGEGQLISNVLLPP